MTEQQKRVKARLRYLDEIVTRHKEQKELVALGKLAATKLTEDEYIAILEEKQNLRESN